MSNIFTFEELVDWSPEDRGALFYNARRMPDGQYEVELIENKALRSPGRARSARDNMSTAHRNGAA